MNLQNFSLKFEITQKNITQSKDNGSSIVASIGTKCIERLGGLGTKHL